MKTLESILKEVNAFVDLEFALPVGDELATRVSYANKAVWEASAVAQLNEFNRVYTAAATASMTLPANFKELKGSPKQNIGGSWVEYPEIDPQEKYNKSSGDRYCYILGNPAGSYVIYFNGVSTTDNMDIPYQAYPSGMATYSDKCELSDPSYVVTKVEAMVLEARGDDRFPYVDAMAEKKLRNLVGRGSKSPGGQYRVAPAGFKNPLS